MSTITLGQGAPSQLNNLPVVLRQDVTVQLTNDCAGFDLSGYIGKGTLTIIGGYTTASVTGYATGTAGAGTTATSLVKPAGGSNWVANALIGKLVRITAGAGIGEVRPIRANTTTNITIDLLTGLDTTSVFQICNPAFEFTSDVTVENCLSPVVFKGIKFTNELITSNNNKVTVQGCEFDGGNWLSEYDSLPGAANCLVKSANRIHFSAVGKAASALACYLLDGQILVEDCPLLSVQGEASLCSANALYFTSIGHAQVEMKASSNLVTPFWFEACGYLEAVGTDKLTGVSNTGYGISVNTSGRYRFIGCTVTGSSGDIDFDGDNVTWANLASSTFGVYQKYGSTLVAESGENKAVIPKPVTYIDTVEIYGRLLSGGYHNMSQATGLTASGTVAGDALQLGVAVLNRVDTVAAGTGVKLTNGALIPGVLCIIHNNGANALKIYPYSGGTVDGGASITLAAGARVMLISISNDGLSWVTL